MAKSKVKAKTKPQSRSTAKKASKKKVKTSASVGKVGLQLGSSIWPLEKDVLFRPDRLKYVRKLIQPQDCVFCRAEQMLLSQESLCLFKSTFAMVVLNKFPYNSGHLLVLPRRHIGDLTQLKEDEYIDLQLVVRSAVQILKDVYQPGGLNLGLNHGAVAGAGIPDHLHYHVIPRWSGDLNFFPLIAETKTVVESLESSYEKLAKAFAELNTAKNLLKRER